MKYFFVYFLLTSAAFGEITQNDLIEIINKVDSYGIVPKSLIDHAKEEVKTLKPADIQQINSASKSKMLLHILFQKIHGLKCLQPISKFEDCLEIIIFLKLPPHPDAYIIKITMIYLLNQM